MEMSAAEKIRYGNEELLVKGNLAAIGEVFAADYVVHAGGKDYHGHKFIQQFTKLLRSAVSDLRVVAVDILIQADTTIAWQRTLTGKHVGNMQGALPSGQILTWRDLVISRFEDGKIVEEWNVSELAGEMLSKPPLK